METILGKEPWVLRAGQVCMLGGDGEGLVVVVGNVSFSTQGRVVFLDVGRDRCECDVSLRST